MPLLVATSVATLPAINACEDVADQTYHPTCTQSLRSFAKRIVCVPGVIIMVLSSAKNFIQTANANLPKVQTQDVLARALDSNDLNEICRLVGLLPRVRSSTVGYGEIDTRA